MRKYLLLWPYIFITLIVPILACGPAASQQFTPTPTKTPTRVKILPQAPIATTTAVLLPTTASTSEALPVNTPTPLPPTETPVPELPPTDTPAPELPPPTTPPPPPPPPPTNTPPPPPPTNTPAPPPPTQPPANEGPQVTIELPGGDTYDVDEDITIIFVVRDPDGVANFTWGIFTLNQTPLIGGEKGCGGATECRLELNETTPPIPDTYLVGADAVDSKGKTVRQVGEIYVH
jgi:hypothetical protein